jgi:hypothetical protein
MSSCLTKTDYNKLEDYCLQTHDFKDLKDIEVVVVIDDKGGCLPCSRNFSEFISLYQNNSKFLFFILASGTQIDISNFQKKKDNVYFDFRREFAKTELLKKSGIIVLKDEEIDTVFEVSPSTTEEVFDFIETNFNQVN